MSDALFSYKSAHISVAGEGHVSHGFYTRKGGVSKGEQSGLNCGLGSADNPSHVSENRALCAQNIGVSTENLLSLYQVHGSDVVEVVQSWPLDNTRPKADAFVTDKAGFGLGILTADCAPVLFYGVKSSGEPVIGAAHAGWRGAFSGVLENTVSALMRLNADPQSIIASVGPCIARASYEVSADFLEPIIEEDEQAERFFHSANREDHAMFDLSGYCAFRLARCGVKTIEILGHDTYKEEGMFYSYRRATHRGEEDYGRQISVIAIKS